MSPLDLAKRRVLGRTTFTIDELEGDAKERARGDWRGHELDFDWWESTYEDFGTICDRLGVTLNGKPTFNTDAGHGVAVDGSYAYKRECRRLIREYAPQDKELHRIVDELYEVQRRCGYKLTATLEGRRYERTTVYADHSVVEAALLSLAAWFLKALRDEEQWRLADEQIDESIRCNEMEFDEDGRQV